MVLLLLALLGCPPPEIKETGDSPVDTGDSPDTQAETADTGETDSPPDTADTAPPHTGDTGDTVPDTADTAADTGDTDTGPIVETGDTGEPPWLPPYDCSALPAAPLTAVELDGPAGYHDVIFDDEGYIIGWDRRTVMKADVEGDTDVFVTGLDSVETMDRLHDGDIVAGDSAAARLVRISDDGGTDTIASDVAAVYGVTVGPDGMVYIANSRAVVRVDPDTGDKERIVEPTGGWQPHVVNFNLDSTVMYIGTIGAGDVYYVELDEDLNPTTEPAVYASIPRSSWHDGLGVDACGNLYVADYTTRGLYRIWTDGTIEELLEGERPTAYGHGMEWGSPYGGWNINALYLPQPYDSDTVKEVDVGVPSASWFRTWKGERVGVWF